MALPTPFLKVRQWLGFSKTYNLILFIIFGGAIFAFSLARLQYLDVGGRYARGAAPGEWYWFRNGHYRIGITLHLATIIPCGLLVVFQFLPIIRRKFILFHRLNGYTILVLLLLSNVGALMIARRAFGGTIETQTGVGVLVIATTIGAAMAYYNIKRLQIEQHRAWMLRTFFYAASIITLRLIMVLTALVITRQRGYYQVRPCEEIEFTYKAFDAGEYLDDYPLCNKSLGALAQTRVPVEARFGAGGGPVATGAALVVPFGMALWFALLLHAAGVEIYLQLTPREHERLRKVSYERQLAAGFKNPGSAGLVVEKFGDAPEWQRPVGVEGGQSLGDSDTGGLKDVAM